MTDSRIEKVIEHYQQNEDTYFEGFLEFLRIPSVSTDIAYKEHIESCADWVVAEMDRIGFKENRKIPTEGYPVVYGEWLEAGEDAPTILVYAHYDVQPIDPIELWETPPFDPTIRDGKLYARGVIDDKCGVWANLKIFESMLAVDGKLPFNVKLFFEGEEETGSPSVQPFVAANSDLLKADAMVLSDGDYMPGPEAVLTALRGMVSTEVTIKGGYGDLHSGQFGGVVHNPLHLAGKIIASFHDESGKVQIPGFYDTVEKPSAEEWEAISEWWEAVGDTRKAQSGVQTFWAEDMGSYLERASVLPTLDVNGITGGYQGDGTKTVLPSEASFKVSMRLGLGQDPAEIAEAFTKYVMGFEPETFSINVEILGTGYPLRGSISGPLVEAKIRTSEALYGKRPYFVRGGGSVPVGATFQMALDMPVQLLGFGAGANVHAPNEYMVLEHYEKAVHRAIHFYYYLAEEMF